MKKLIALLLALLLASASLTALAEGFNAEAFMLQFQRQSLKLEPAQLPGAALGAQWLTASPSGRYHLLLGFAGLMLYDAEMKEARPVTIDMRGDANGKLARLLSNPQRQLATATFVWSADEAYFTVYNWDLVMKQMNMDFDLLLGSTETCQVTVAQSWGAKVNKAGSGTLYGACFAPDNSKLYFDFYGSAYEELDPGRTGKTSMMTLAYDMATGEVTHVAGNRWETRTGDQLFCDREGMVCLKDGSIVQLATDFHGTLLHLRRMIPTAAGWEEELLELPSPELPSTYALEGINGSDRVLVTMLPGVYDTQSATSAKNVVVQVDLTPAGLEVLRLTSGVNAVISPDGRYYATLSGSHEAWSLQVTDSLSGQTCAVDASAVKQVADFAYVAGGNALAAKSFYPGMMWCGNTLVIGTNDGPALFSFAGVD